MKSSTSGSCISTQWVGRSFGFGSRWVNRYCCERRPVSSATWSHPPSGSETERLGSMIPPAVRVLSSRLLGPINSVMGSSDSRGADGRVQSTRSSSPSTAADAAIPMMPSRRRVDLESVRVTFMDRRTRLGGFRCRRRRKPPSLSPLRRRCGQWFGYLVRRQTTHAWHLERIRSRIRWRDTA